MRVLVPVMDDEIADVWNPCECIGENENGIPFPNRINQQKERAGQAQPPKRRRHDDAFLFLRRIPLHEKTREKNRVADPADNLPNAPFDAKKFAIVPD